ncbi:26S proteasome non-ATPase regulatory subunit 1 [Phakopsora pachyrhizi]|uniref:26S proteasome regulatory subunit RPN2 n=1 Tax=Phakopsora pachyrhizi TaxID=170000 RepID=A0AAV0B1T9_PHAPC|nr:26S proteasome non-ATPase regulatory subunit 1 [Phakopsora pachyrhizi]CAH7676109.1 26S proteasome non-ATPase regulatory subunit 1 [Phakopsora pachyrhizi]
MTNLTSSSGVLALLDEDELSLKTYALEQLDRLVYEFWPEVADGISKIEILYEDEALPPSTRSLAALVASKVYYHLGDLNESLQFALGAGERFDVERVGTAGTDGEFVEVVVSECIDAYISLCTAHENNSSVSDQNPTIEVDRRMTNIVERMFSRCIETGEYRQALGIALESRRLDIIQLIASRYSSEDDDLLGYLMDASLNSVTNISFRNELLRLSVRLLGSQKNGPDYFSIAKCYVYLDDSQPAAQLLSELLSDGKNKEKLLIAYQLCFDLAETATQEFLEVIRTKLAKSSTEPGSSAAAGGMVIDSAEGSSKPNTDDHIERARKILTGEETTKLHLEFLYRNNHADLLILKQTKDALDGRSSLYHNAVSFANAFANAGTTSDKFLRDNLDWLSKASNWSKFSATAGLGVIHRGNLSQGMEILQPYLPSQGGASSSFYSEGGSLFALGIIHANHGGNAVLDYIRNVMKSSNSDIIEHGAALGLGVAGMSSGNEDVYEDLRDVLYHDSAVAGEAAGYAMGLLMLGSGSTKALDEMLQYAHETQHEKIIRGLAIGISLIFYGKEQVADGVIETLTSDKDPILRYGGIYTVAMAYAGTGNNKAIRRLLHVAVSDVNDDVRRAAVTSLGFLLFRNPSQVPRVVQLLSESYNPNVRYGAALALGIACAGTGMEEAISLLEPMTKDTVDYVKQGACIALAMILIQQNETLNPKTTMVRKIFEKIISDKHEDAMAKFGATLAQGIIDSGGRNVTVSMRSKNGNNNMTAIVGMALFNQFWYWFPMAHTLALAFTPTAIIGVDQELKMPQFEFYSNARPSLFAYQTATAPPTAEKVEKLATAVLSTTAKAKAREKTKKDKQNSEDMDMTPAPESPTGQHGDDAMKIDEADLSKPNNEPSKAEGSLTKTSRRRKDEPQVDKLSNLTRVTPYQLPFITFPENSRYVPVRPLTGTTGLNGKITKSVGSSTTSMAYAILNQNEHSCAGSGGGILLMRDRTPELPAEFLEFTSLKNGTGANNNREAEGGATGGGGTTDDPDHALLEGEISELPPSFEYNFDS